MLHGVPWWTSVALRDALDDQSGLNMTYLKGTLEPELDLARLSSFVVPGENRTRLAKAYQAALRGP